MTRHIAFCPDCTWGTRRSKAHLAERDADRHRNETDGHDPIVYERQS